MSKGNRFDTPAAHLWVVNPMVAWLSHAAGGQILITQATAADLGPRLRLRSLMPPLLVKGKSGY